MINGSQRYNLMKIYNPQKVGVIKKSWQYSTETKWEKTLKREIVLHGGESHYIYQCCKGIL